MKKLSFIIPLILFFMFPVIKAQAASAEVRFYVCPLAYDAASRGKGYYPALDDYHAHIRWSAVIPVDSKGQPKFSTCLVMVVANDHTIYQKDLTLIDIFSGLTLVTDSKTNALRILEGTKLTDVSPSTSQKILANLTATGISQVNAKIASSDSLLKALRIELEYFKDDRDAKTYNDSLEATYLGE